MASLAAFQQAFAQALLAAPGAPATATVSTLAAQAGFAVHRNTLIKGLTDALQANYPAVARLTGDEWFRAAAAGYALAHPPADPVLLKYGASFPAFLAAFEPARALPYLPGVAQLDRLWSEAHGARDEPPLDGAVLAGLAPEQLACSVLYPHAAARWAWFADAPIFSIWAHNRGDASVDGAPWEPRWHAEGALIARASDTVQWQALDAASHAFLDACGNGGTLAQAAAAAHAMDSTADLQSLMAWLLRAGAFSRASVTRMARAAPLASLKTFFKNKYL